MEALLVTPIPVRRMAFGGAKQGLACRRIMFMLLGPCIWSLMTLLGRDFLWAMKIDIKKRCLLFQVFQKRDYITIQWICTFCHKFCFVVKSQAQSLGSNIQLFSWGWWSSSLTVWLSLSELLKSASLIPLLFLFCPVPFSSFSVLFNHSYASNAILKILTYTVQILKAQ